jgi:Flp pilus assembly protein CpaB
MNLRDKLRGQSAPEAESVVAAEPAPETTGRAFQAEAPEPASAPAKGKDKAKAKGLASMNNGSILAKLDVNRRFLLLAGTAAALASVMAVMYLSKASSGLEAAGKPIKVLVAADDISAGARLTEDMFKFKELPASVLIDEQFFEDFEDLDGRLAVAPMVAGEPVYKIRTSPPNPKYGIAYLLKGGERAKSINVDSASGMAGLIKPGNEVDLVATIPDPQDNTRRISTPVLQKARVIAVGDILLGAPPPSDEDTVVDNGISSTGTITLAVPAPKVALITLLEDLGNLKAILRAEGDDTVVENGYSDSQVMAIVSGRIPPKEAPPKPKPAYVPPPAQPRVVKEVVRQAPPKPAYVPPKPKPPAPKPVQAAPKPKPPAPKPAAKPPREVQVIQFGQ